MLNDVIINKMSRDELVYELRNSDRLNEENAKLLVELITAREEIKQLKLKLQRHEDRIKQNEALLQ